MEMYVIEHIRVYKKIKLAQIDILYQKFASNGIIKIRMRFKIVWHTKIDYNF